jgi:hypothetical protein
VLVAIGVAQSGYREILAVSEGAKEDTASWTAFLRGLKERGLKGVELFVSDKCLGLVENLADFYPEGPLSPAENPFLNGIRTQNQALVTTGWDLEKGILL